ncbi:MAG: imidazole glycerol phosphate synthase subunit HisF [Microscillaceae bacterium]|nr:imidazole glycerol phosphate synthase subunit HisF [Microscillaceae bacterium]MDW8460688.1 imidazole glycerol phosphate synthase subunit HisF [Cytophagales bacterium]
MHKKRIIPCLDIKDGKTVKGIHFENLKEVGNPVELAQRYAQEGADELVFLDITATVENRKTFAELVKKIARVINIPFTVGGGISTVKDVGELLNAGADKVSINSAAVYNPDLIDELAKHFGSQCIVIAIDTNLVDNFWRVFVQGGRKATKLDTFVWASEVEERGAGELLLTSMKHDGTKKGFAVMLTSKIAQLVNIPVIASGGAGTLKHFADILTEGKADAALAASVFHFGEIRIKELKNFLASKQIPVRLG